MATKVPSLKGDKVAVDLGAGEPREVSSASDIAARFEVQKLLGEGGMGSVFVAQDRGLGRIVALKRLRDGLEKDRSAMRRFVLEAQIGAQLEHPNIVPLYSFEHSEGGAPAITMQLLEGTSMADYIHNAAAAPKSSRTMRGEYSLKERIGTLIGVCEAIHFAHERGVIHRDLKPDNVMLGRYHEVYVMDWGLARVVGSPIDMARERHSNGDDRRELPPEDLDKEKLGTLPTVATSDSQRPGGESALATRQGDVMGTAQYMPPEQALGHIDRLGPTADQYSLGVMLQELATLKPARSHTSHIRALSEALTNHLETPIDVDGQALDPALAAIVSRATQKNPSDRYESVNAMTEDLRRFIRGEPVSVYREGLARRLVRAAARRPVLAMSILSVCGFLASVAIVGAVIRDARRTEQQARELENVRRIIVAVSGRAHDIDEELSELAANVKAIGAATVELLARESDDFDGKARPLPALTPHETYGGAGISFEGIVVSWPDKAPGARMPLSAAKLAHLEPWLRTCLVDALPPADRKSSIVAQNIALFAGRSALLRGFVGLEDGSFVQFPAREVTADPRVRPWYAMARQEAELHWTRPVVDMAKKTVRISALLGLRSKDTFVGVAGCDMRVSWLARKLALDLPGFRSAYLVAEDGKIAVREGLEEAILAKVTNPDIPLDLPVVADPGLAARIAGKDRGGYVESGDRLLVFAKLNSPAWTYVAELDRAQYLARESKLSARTLALVRAGTRR